MHMHHIQNVIQIIVENVNYRNKYEMTQHGTVRYGTVWQWITFGSKRILHYVLKVFAKIQQTPHSPSAWIILISRNKHRSILTHSSARIFNQSTSWILSGYNIWSQLMCYIVCAPYPILMWLCWHSARTLHMLSNNETLYFCRKCIFEMHNY